MAINLDITDLVVSTDPLNPDVWGANLKTALTTLAMNVIQQLSGSPDTATSGTLNADEFAWISAASGNVSRALPTGIPLGHFVILGKSDTGAHTVTATGTINGVGSQSAMCAVVGETAGLMSDGSGGWLLLWGNLTAAYDTRYQAAGSAVGASLAYNFLATGVSSISLPNGVWEDITGAPLTISPVVGTRAIEVVASLVVQSSSAAAAILVGIYDVTAAAMLNPSSSAATFTASGFQTLRCSAQVTPGAGTRTYVPRILSLASGTITATVYGANVNGVSSMIKGTQR